MAEINRIEQTYRRLTASGKNVLRLFSGNPTEHGFRFPPEILKKSYDRFFQSQEYHPHPKGLPEARRAIQNYYATQNTLLDLEHIILTSGTSESFFYLFSLLAKLGDNILIPNPSYPLFDDIAKLAGVTLRPYSLREDQNWAVDLEDLHNKTDSRTRAIVLVSPNNPTGSVISAEQIQEIVAWANQKDISLICDEVFSEFYFGKNVFPRALSVSKPKLCFILNGISKMFALPALKLSWIGVGGEKNRVEIVVDQLETLADTFLSTHTPIQEALPALFTEGWSFVQDYRREVQERRDLAVSLLKACPPIHFNPPVGSYYLMGEITKKIPSSEEEFVIRLMEEKNVFIHPGYFYDYEKGIHFVISFLTKKEKLKDGLEALISIL